MHIPRLAEPPVLLHYDWQRHGRWWRLRWTSGDPLEALALFPMEASALDVRATAEHSLDAEYENPWVVEPITVH